MSQWSEGLHCITFGIFFRRSSNLQWTDPIWTDRQLSSTEFSHGAAKKEKFTRPTVSQSTRDAHFYPFFPSDESNSSPRHTASDLWPRNTVFIIRWRRDLNVKITVSWENHERCRPCWSPITISKLTGARGNSSCVFDGFCHFVSNSTSEWGKNSFPFCFAFNSGGLHEYCNTDVQLLWLQLS